MFNYNNRYNPIVLFCSGKGSRQSSKKSFLEFSNSLNYLKLEKNDKMSSLCKFSEILRGLEIFYLFPEITHQPIEVWNFSNFFFLL